MDGLEAIGIAMVDVMHHVQVMPITNVLELLLELLLLLLCLEY
jgi:hypothetical protein